MKAKTNMKAGACPTMNHTSAYRKKITVIADRFFAEPMGRLFIVGAALVVLPLTSFAGVLSGRPLPEGAGTPKSLTLQNSSSRISDQAMNQDGNNQDDNGNTGVYSARSKPYGLSYGEWSARWWQWILSIPTQMNPNLDSTGAHCAEGQSGHVWFLPGA
jgi:hypothetical protein